MRWPNASRRRWWGAVVFGMAAASLLAMLVLFFLYPLGSLLVTGLVPDGALDLSGFTRIFSEGYFGRILGFTLGQAAVSTVLTLVIAIPAAVICARYRFPFRNALLSLWTLPFVLPTLVVATAFSALLGERGLLNTWLVAIFGLESAPIQIEQSIWIILLAHVYYNLPLALRLLVGYASALDSRYEDAARTLGAAGWHLWWTIRLPLLLPAIASAALLVFVFTFSSFGVILLLGGFRFATLEVEIYRQVTSFFNLPVASALSVVQLVIMYLMMLGYAFIAARMPVSGFATRSAVERTARTPRERALVAITVGGISLFLGAPLASLVWRSLYVPEVGLSLRYFTALGSNPRGSVLVVPPAEAIGNSLLFAAAATALALALGLAGAYLTARRTSMARVFEPLVLLPLATSAVTLGYGYTVALGSPPFDLRTSVVLIPIAHAIVAIPLVFRSIVPSLRNIPAHVREVALLLGATPMQRARTVELPLIARALAVGAAFAFTTSMGEFGASLFLARPGSPTIPIVINRLFGQPGAQNYGQALAMSTILLVTCLLAFLLIERWREIGFGDR
jgi:thiamine transport system permease protein